MRKNTHIAMWSGPRNLSTALMYSFLARGDCAAWDEPFYAAYLAETGLNHPMREAILAAGETDPDKVAERAQGPIPHKKTLFYQKHMTQHMTPGMPRSWMRHVQNVLLIRHPARVVASFAKKYEEPALADIGFLQQAALFDQVADDLGHPPTVVDSYDIRQAPAEMLQTLCHALGIAWTPSMLKWPLGGCSEDGIWASHWYGAVHRSTGFAGAEGSLPDLPQPYQKIVDQALPIYERLKAFSLSSAVPASQSGANVERSAE